MNKTATQRDPLKDAAAQNAQEGVVTVADLSLLTGIPVPQLTKLAKSGRLEYFGEYHGKRFFNFQRIVSWAVSRGDDDEARTTIRKAMEAELRSDDCPYSIETVPSAEHDDFQVKISWKVAPVS